MRLTAFHKSAKKKWMQREECNVYLVLLCNEEMQLRCFQFSFSLFNNGPEQVVQLHSIIYKHHNDPLLLPALFCDAAIRAYCDIPVVAAINNNNNYWTSITYLSSQDAEQKNPLLFLIVFPVDLQMFNESPVHFPKFCKKSLSFF